MDIHELTKARRDEQGEAAVAETVRTVALPFWRAAREDGASWSTALGVTAAWLIAVMKASP